MSADALSAAETLSLLAGRISHILRTPLGTASAILDDLHNGLSLEPRDIQDARQALGRIREALDLVKACVVDFRLEDSCSLHTIALDVADSLKMSGLEVAVTPEDLNTSIVESCCPALLHRALELLARCLYGLDCSGPQHSQLTLTLKIDAAHACFVYHAPSRMIPRMAESPASCGDLAREDHSLQGLLLLFVEQAARFHRGSARVWQSGSGVSASLQVARTLCS